MQTVWTFWYIFGYWGVFVPSQTSLAYGPGSVGHRHRYITHRPSTARTDFD